jgi:hypothetical protein
MKNIAMLLFSIFTFQSVKAQQICEDYIPNEWPDNRYTIETVLGDNIVTDHKTGLQWKQCSEGLSGTDCMTGTATTHTWQQALDLADGQNLSDYAGYTDWRLPNIEELRSLAAINCYNPSINENVFPNTTSNWFWSFSPFASNDYYAWVVYFGSGYGGGFNRSNGYGVRLVRSGQ